MQQTMAAVEGVLAAIRLVIGASGHGSGNHLLDLRRNTISDKCDPAIFNAALDVRTPPFEEGVNFKSFIREAVENPLERCSARPA